MQYNLDRMQDCDKSPLINTLYHKDMHTWEEIAELCNCSRGKIRRLAQKFGIRSRTRSEAQELVIETYGHPLEGTTRTIEEKQKISDSMGKHWDCLTQEQREHKSNISKDLWKNRDPEENKRIQQAGALSIHHASREGSKLEKYLAFELEKLNYKVELHKERHLKNQALQIDLFLPILGVAIEVDGPTHFKPVFGEDQLKRIQKSDRQKTGLILSAGLYFIRVKHLQKLSYRFQRDTLAKIVTILDNLSTYTNKLFEV